MADDRPTYTSEEVDRAVDALGSPDRFAHAQEIVTHAAPGLQRVLNAALDEGGYFGEASADAIRKAASEEDPQRRQMALQALVTDETRIGMLIGVAVGLELAHELLHQSSEKES